MARTILVVDDDFDTLQLVGTMLERQGYEIVAANNGQKALDLAEKHKPDLILLDVMMPGMDGYEVTRRLRAMENTAFIPIILFNAKAQVDDKVEGFEAGADDYLTKPTHPAELIARVKTIFTRTGSLTMPEEQEPEKKADIIGVIAAKGGLGVSTLALNLAISLHQQSEEFVTLAELRPGQGDIGIYLGYTQSEMQTDLLHRNAKDIKARDVQQALVTHGSGVQLLLSSFAPTDTHLMQAGEQFEAIVKQLAKSARYLVLDMGAGLPLANRKIVNLCDQLVVVIEPSQHAIEKTKELLAALEQRGVQGDKIKVVLVNRVRMEITIPAPQIQQQLGHKLANILTPAPELAYQAAMRHEPLIRLQPENLTSQQIKKLAQSLL
jgi:DNA-binding response OmpR family regulator